MRRSRQLKNEKELKRRYGRLAESMEEYYHQLDLRPLSEMDDEAFAFIMKKVKGINMLDLNETEIGNESIRLLTTLEYVKEMRAKGCRNLNDDCIAFLGQIKELEFLHLKGTGITIDGLLQLDPQLPLKTLMFSAAEEENDLVPKMNQLKKLFPGCEFVVNSKTYIF